jgi:hypothetical protein
MPFDAASHEQPYEAGRAYGKGGGNESGLFVAA